MYLKKLVYKNVGSLHDLTIDMPFNNDASPKPIILVGENGSGKTTLLSNIVDSFYEIAGVAFCDVHIPESNYTYQYFKIISSEQITLGKEYLYSYIQYDNSIEYIYKTGNITFDAFKYQNPNCSNNLNWGQQNNFKKIIATEKQVEDQFNSTVFCYFGADRYEQPSWIGDKYYNNALSLHPSVISRYSGRIPNPISVKDVTEPNLQWLLDVIVDSRLDTNIINGSVAFIHRKPSELINVASARIKIEELLSNILNKDVYFGLNYRNQGKSRFDILLKKNNKVIVPSLDSLSTGEIVLFNLFSTIIRYADKLNIYNSFNLNRITGIVIIDEIELHLHTKLQREVLPKLIKLFPKIQFIITTHSPLFLLGMSQEFGDDGFEIYQLPTGTQITAESFSEFQRAFDYMTETQQYQKEVQKAIQDATDSKPLIITEGSTDWRHIKTAMKVLSQQECNKSLFEGIDIDFLEFDPKNTSGESKIKLEMCNTTLCSMCKEYSKIKQNRKLIFIADRDNKQTNDILGDNQNNMFKKWGNNVYSLILPLPTHRNTTPNICIEHYYTDKEIKTSVEVNGLFRRLYLGNEFDKYGRGIQEDIMCEKANVCGENRINIIEGSQGERVLRSKHGSEDNLALSKMEFAKRVLKQEPPFDKFSFDAFLNLFIVINEIIKLPLE